MQWLVLITSIHTANMNMFSHSMKLRKILKTQTALRNAGFLAVVAEYQLDKFKTLLSYAVGAVNKGSVQSKEVRKEIIS